MTPYSQRKNNSNDSRSFKFETIKSSRKWHNIFQLLKISFKIEGENQTLSNEGKLRKFVTSRPSLKE